MAAVSAWLMTIIMLEFTIGSFLLFAARGAPWVWRGVGALFGLGCFIIFAAFAYQLATGRADAAVALDPKLAIFAFLFVNLFGFQLVHRLAKRPEGFGCFGTILRLAGCALIGWAAFALVLLGIALAMGLVSVLD